MGVPEEYCRKLTKDEINEMPLRAFEGPVTLVDTDEAVGPAVERLRKDTLLGFDTETRPSFKKGVSYPPALLQLANSDEVFIFQLGKITFDDGLVALLTDAGVIKSGVSVRDDVKELKSLADFPDAGFVDLADVARDCGIQTFGLRNMAANLLGFRISKAMQCSNWAKGKLSRKQVRYAATDAWVSRELHLRLQVLGVL